MSTVREDWQKARVALLAKEKALSKLRDELAAERRALPRVPVETNYVFEGANGKAGLADLFDGKSQLITYHFMFAPDWENPCKSCSFWAEQFDGLRTHLPHRDTTLVAIANAPYAKLAAVKERMGWRFPFFSAGGSDFNHDFGVSFTPEEAKQGAPYNFGSIKFRGPEAPGASVFLKDKGAIFHTYSTYGRGLDVLNGTYQWLDLTPKGRDEDPDNHSSWLRLKDRYE